MHPQIDRNPQMLSCDAIALEKLNGDLLGKRPLRGLSRICCFDGRIGKQLVAALTKSEEAWFSLRNVRPLDFWQHPDP